MVVARYDAARGDAGFDLRGFVEQHFVLPQPAEVPFRTDTTRTMEQHIRALWPVLTRRADSAHAYTSRIALPNAYVVPGRRFREVYYRDSYFTMLGLLESGRTDLVRSMLDNFAYLVQRIGYWDERSEPRPESYREDYTLAQTLPASQRAEFYRNVRAAAESGWDFSSRWMRDPADLRTLETTALAPIDLNSLLYHTERTIAALHAFRGETGDAAAAQRYATMAERRRRALLASAWDADSAFFFDVRWRIGERVSDRPTMAAAALLYFGVATPAQGRAVAGRLQRDFLRVGGFVTTLIDSGQQWDAPNGWPPLQWLAIEGLRRYGRIELAADARARWLALNRRTFEATGRMVEKYDVVDPNRAAGGGEYPTQDGFGWTNGVALRLAAQYNAGRRRVRIPRKVY